MLISKESEVTLNSANMNYYKDLGYEIPTSIRNYKTSVARGTKITVKCEDLKKTSSYSFVEVKCDYCGEIKTISYRDYYKSLNSSIYIQKYCCKGCLSHKKEDIKNMKHSMGIMKKEDKGYWTLEENRMYELKKYINDFKYLDHIYDSLEGSALATNSSIYDKGGFRGLILKCGFDINKVYLENKSKRTVNQLSEIINTIEKFIELHNRFPKQTECADVLNIPNSHLSAYGGIENIKKEMKYDDECDLIDDLGYKNKSTYEYFVAQ